MGMPFPGAKYLSREQKSDDCWRGLIYLHVGHQVNGLYWTLANRIMCFNSLTHKISVFFFEGQSRNGSQIATIEERVGNIMKPRSYISQWATL